MHGMLALAGGTIYRSPTEEPIVNGVVVVRDGRIESVGTDRPSSGTPLIDCSGLTITAGFWNSHVHFFERKWSDAATLPAAELTRQLEHFLTRYGFTSVFDLGSMWTNTRALRDRIESGEVAGPRIRSTGEALVAPAAMPGETVFRMMGIAPFPAPEIANAEDAARVARRLLDDGTDGIKVHMQTGSIAFPPDAIRAAADQAHRAGKPLFAHPNSGADVMAAVRNGVDVIGHTTPASGPWNGEVLTAVNDHRVALTPTLTLWKFFMRHERLSVQEQLVSTAVEQLRAWIAAGGTVLFGTDLGAVDPDPGDEYKLMARAGMTFRDILASLTTTPAARFGVAHRVGRIAAGYEADLVAFAGERFADVRYTIRAGRVLFG